MKEKSRYWTFIMYPESMPDNWKEIIQVTGVQGAISPLHDKDIYDSDTETHKKGELKKEHYHVLLCFQGPTTYKNICSITEQLNATIPKKVMSPIGIIRYFSHEDNPEKAQYDKEEIKIINGLNIKNLELSEDTNNLLKIEIIKLIIALKIEEYSDLVEYCIKNELTDLCKIVLNNSQMFNTYLRSKNFKREKILDSYIKKS